MLHTHYNFTTWLPAQDKSCISIFNYNTADCDEPEDPSPARGAGADAAGIYRDHRGVARKLGFKDAPGMGDGETLTLGMQVVPVWMPGQDMGKEKAKLAAERAGLDWIRG
jgi:hypothetical protein